MAGETLWGVFIKNGNYIYVIFFIYSKYHSYNICYMVYDNRNKEFKK